MGGKEQLSIAHREYKTLLLFVYRSRVQLLNIYFFYVMYQYCFMQPMPLMHFYPYLMPQNEVPAGGSTQIKGEETTVSQNLLGLNRSDLQATTYEVMKRPWSEEEDERLVQLVDQEKMSWNDISRVMQDRTYKMCYSRYKRIKLNAKNSWTHREDQLLRDLVQEYGKQWKHFAKHFQGRTSKQIRQRYINILKPEASRDMWTIDEDVKLVELINKFGKRWKMIQNQMPHRSQNQLKNRYFSRLLKLWRKKRGKQRKL